MKILVFGSTGFFGKNVMRMLSEGHELYSADRQLNTASAHSLVVDVLDEDAVVKVLHAIRPEVVINCAGVVENSLKAMLNPVITMNILKAVSKSGIILRRCVVSGSASEYGIVKKGTVAISEEAPLNASVGYGLSKRQETTLAREYGKENGRPVVVARIFNPVGRDMNPRMLVPGVIKQIARIRSGEEVTIQVSRIDSQRDYIDIRDVARAVKMIIEHDLSYDVYNVGTGISTTNGQLIDCIVRHSALSVTPSIIETMDTPEPLVASKADITRIKKELGWKPKYTLEEAVKEIINATK